MSLYKVEVETPGRYVVKLTQIVPLGYRPGENGAGLQQFYYDGLGTESNVITVPGISNSVFTMVYQGGVPLRKHVLSGVVPVGKYRINLDNEVEFGSGIALGDDIIVVY